LGNEAGYNVSTASNVICIGAPGDDVSDSCFIGNIFGQASASGIAVLINGNGRLGTTTSSKRFKEEIKSMDKASETLFALRPVTFHYTREIDPVGKSQFGLVAEDVEKVNPDLVVRDKEGKPYSVRYDQVNAMLLNEFLKEHRTVQALTSTVAKQEAIIAKQQKDFQATAAHQQKQIESLTAGLQKVSAQLELSKAAPQTVLNDQ
jgi:trimeric autotransporter adhesin